jgi:hypothetical protein
MFVEINNTELKTWAIHYLIARNEHESREVVSPEFALEVLSKTNHSGNIKRMIYDISSECKTKEELMPYKEFILSCVEGREQSEKVKSILCKQASVCGFLDEFVAADSKPKLYGSMSASGVTVHSKEELEAIEGKGQSVYYAGDVAKLDGVDLSKFYDVKFIEGCSVEFGARTKLPYKLDVSLCSDVKFGLCNLASLGSVTIDKSQSSILEKARNFDGEVKVVDNDRDRMIGMVSQAIEDNGVVSPELAMEILGKTKNPEFIEGIIGNIAKKCETEEQMKPYEKFILNCAGRRNLSRKAMDDLRYMADVCVCRDKFEYIYHGPGISMAD